MDSGGAACEGDEGRQERMQQGDVCCGLLCGAESSDTCAVSHSGLRDLPRQFLICL